MIGRQQYVLTVDDATNNVEVSVTCVFCNVVQPTLYLSRKAWEGYSSGGYFVQDVFPELSVDERELLISAVCSKCWGDIL